MNAIDKSARTSYCGRKVLVTGADGFIGSHLVEMLVAEGANVTALSLYNSFDSYGWLDELPDDVRRSADLVRGDVRDDGFVRRIVRGQDIVFHLAALITIPHSYVAPRSYIDTNVVGTLNVLEAARDFEVGRVVQTSTSEVYGTALTMPITEFHPLQGQSPYSASKIAADMLCESFVRSFAMPVAIIRPFNTFGPRQSERAIIPTVVRQVLDFSCDTISVGDTSPVRDFTFVRDTAAAFLAIGAAPKIEFGRPYNAGSNKAVTIAQTIEAILALTGCNKRVQEDAVRNRPANSEVRALLADSRRFSEETGWRPAHDLHDGLKQTIAWWRERLAAGKVRRELSFMS
ncbi:MAG: SDR family NAD(P)-dependent oxidoreductase [Hyphomicrobium sp.]